MVYVSRRAILLSSSSILASFRQILGHGLRYLLRLTPVGCNGLCQFRHLLHLPVLLHVRWLIDALDLHSRHERHAYQSKDWHSPCPPPIIQVEEHEHANLYNVKYHHGKDAVIVPRHFVYRPLHLVGADDVSPLLRLPDTRPVVKGYQDQWCNQHQDDDEKQEYQLLT